MTKTYTNIIDAWQHVATVGGQEAVRVALDELVEQVEEETGTRPTIDHSLLSKWRTGKQSPPPAVLRVMARYAAGMAASIVLESAGLSPATMIGDEALERLAAMMSPPLRERVK